MRPHTQYLNGFFTFVDFINKAMLYIDSARIKTEQIANKFFVRRRILKRICGKNFKQFNNFAF